MIPVQRWNSVVENIITDDPIGTVHTHGPFESAGYNVVRGLFVTEARAVMQIQFSFNDTNWDWIEQLTADVNQPTTSILQGSYRYSFQVPAPRMRIVITNGDTIADLRYSAYLVPI